jgi:FemAB-related protein (PEP-CTERM system-associated)
VANSEKEAQLWQQFVDSHAACSKYHRWGWKQVIENSFGWQTFYLMLEENSSIKGILPLVWQKSWLFGSFLTSLPFLNGGGVAAETEGAEKALVWEAIALARRLGTTHVELRHRRVHRLDLPAKTHKVAVVRQVEPDTEKMWRLLHHKVRTDIRKALKSGLVAEFGREELLDDFYKMFTENMRNLGTPSYGRNFFQHILRAFPVDSHICIVRHGSNAVAASLLTAYRDTVEAAWSSSLRSYRSMKPNMLLYWELLCFAGKNGYRNFDFGRSSIGSGTHRFKMQWGSQEVPLFWLYWLRDGSDLPELNPQNPRYRMALWGWQRLPLALTKLVGPRIARCLP